MKRTIIGQADFYERMKRVKNPESSMINTGAQRSKVISKSNLDTKRSLTRLNGPIKTMT